MFIHFYAPERMFRSHGVERLIGAGLLSPFARQMEPDEIADRLMEYMGHEVSSVARAVEHVGVPVVAVLRDEWDNPDAHVQHPEVGQYQRLTVYPCPQWDEAVDVLESHGLSFCASGTEWAVHPDGYHMRPDGSVTVTTGFVLVPTSYHGERFLTEVIERVC